MESSAVGSRRLILSGLVCVAALATMVCAADSAAANATFEKVVIVGEDHKNGIFDPSVEYGDDGIGWMTYSKVEWPARVSIHLARTGDRGKTWNYVQSLFESTNDKAFIEGESRDVVWRFETSSLQYDPGDEPQKRWKVFAQRLFSTPPHGPGNSYWSRGWIEYRHAAAPDGEWSEPVRLFGDRANGCRIDLTTLHPDLDKILYFNEIGSLLEDDVMYLSLDASPTLSGLGDWQNRMVILIRSRDHGDTWDYVGTLTDYSDAQAFGYLVFTATSLARKDGRQLLLASPAGDLTKENTGHDGVFVIEFENIAQAKLQRDAEGKLAVLKKIAPNLTSGGPSDYHEENSYGGIMFGQIDVKTQPDFFQIFATREQIVME